jgi:O-antigen/teichoic acid export membrane protein
MTSPRADDVPVRVEPRPLLGSSFNLTAGLLISAGLGFAFHLMAGRGLGPGGYGAFAASLTYAALWAIVMEAGISVALIREGAADPGRLAWTPRLALWKLGLGLAGTAGALASAWLAGASPEVLLLVGIMAPAMIGLTGLRLAFAVFRVVGAFEWEAALASLQKVALLLLAAGALLIATRPVGVAVAFALSYWASAAVALARAWRELGRTGPAASEPRLPPPGFLLRVCAPLFAIDLLTGLYFKVDQIILLHLRGPEETGLYAAAYRVIEALLLLVGGVMGALFLRLAATARGEPDVFAAHFARAWIALWLGGLVLAVNGWLWAARLLPVAFGRAYAPAQAQLLILLGAVPLSYVNYLLTQSLIAMGRERFYAAGAGVCAAFNIGLNLLLIPRAGASGAAWASLATEAALLLICLGGLGGVARNVPLAPTLLGGAASGLAGVGGGALLAESPGLSALLALAVSIGLWEALSPWPLWRLWPAARAREG